MTARTVRGETAGDVRRVCRFLIGCQMARLTVRRQVHERLLSRRSRRVARPAVGRRMRALERECGHLVRLTHRRHIEEAPRRMTLRAIRAELALMCVTMARHAVARHPGEVETRVAGDA